MRRPSVGPGLKPGGPYGELAVTTESEEVLAEALRLLRLQEINSSPSSREDLVGEYGWVWDTQELTEEFEVEGFLAPFVVVVRKSDQQKGSLEFQHSPRFYFNFEPHFNAK
jgi:hypothetical protein